jgi:hypothetical protein
VLSKIILFLGGNKEMKRFKFLRNMTVLTLALVLALSTVAFAANEVFEATIPDYKVFVDGVKQDGLMYNIGGYTFMKARPFTELLGGTVEWDEAKKEAKFNSKVVEAPAPVIVTENVSLSWNEVQKQVVRIAVETKTETETTATPDSTTTQTPATTQLKVIGNGVFVKGNRVLTTIDTYKNYEDMINTNTVKTEVGGDIDENGVEAITEQTTTSVTGIKIILSNGTVKDAKNYRTDDDRIMGLLDTKAYTSKAVAKAATKDLAVGEMSVLCTSIFSNGDQNPLQVANQFSFGEVLKTRYPRNNQYFTISDNDTDNADSGRAGAIFNEKGELAGIFNAIEVGNNGNCLFTPISVINEFLND